MLAIRTEQMQAAAVITVKPREVEVIIAHPRCISIERVIFRYLDQSAVTTSTQRILSARSINYRRAPRVKPVDLDLSEECEKISGTFLCQS